MLIPIPLAAILTREITPLLLLAWQASRPHLAKLLADPGGTISRIGDSLVWTGPSGRTVIGGLEMVAESQGRIDAAVNGIQSAQVVMQGMLGVVSSVSIATLGVTSLTGAFMQMRLHALNKRIDSLSKSIKDVEGKIDAQNKAHLKSSLQYLKAYDDNPNDKGNLAKALEESRRAANIYGTVAADEANDQARLPVLNLRGRLYVVSLLTELRCMMSDDSGKQALDRIEEEAPTLKQVAAICFSKTLKEDPERYLRASFQSQGVNLNLLASIYKQARQLQVIDQPQVDDANEMFEYVRAKLEAGNGYRAWFKRGNVNDEMQKLRYLLACLEETSRIEGLRLLVADVNRQKRSLPELLSQLREWKQNQVKQETAGEAPPVYAYAL